MNGTIKATPTLFVECGPPHDRGTATRDISDQLTPREVLGKVAELGGATNFSYGQKLELTVDGVPFEPVMQRGAGFFPYDPKNPVTPPPVPVKASEQAVSVEVRHERFFNVDYSGHHDGGIDAKSLAHTKLVREPMDLAARLTQSSDGRFVMGFWYSQVPKATVGGTPFTAKPQIGTRYLIGDAHSYADFMRTAENAEVLAWNLKATPDSTLIRGATGRWQVLGKDDVHISFAAIAAHIRDASAKQHLGV